MADSVPPPVIVRPPTAWQVASAMALNLAAIGSFSLFTYWGKMDGTIAAILIAAVSGLDLAKVSKLRNHPGMSAALGAVSISQWLGRVG